MNYLSALLLGFAFLLGSIPFAFIFAKQIKGIDLRKWGSGNPGATNALRLLGIPYGILILTLDIIKGALPVYFSYTYLSFEANLDQTVFAFLAGIFAVAGHIWSPFLGGKGGRGVATFIGVFAVIYPYGVLVSAIIAVVIILFTRTVSAGSLTGSLILPISCFFFFPMPFTDEQWFIFGAAFFSALLIWVRHGENIKRLKEGKELKIGPDVDGTNSNG